MSGSILFRSSTHAASIFPTGTVQRERNLSCPMTLATLSATASMSSTLRGPCFSRSSSDPHLPPFASALRIASALRTSAYFMASDIRFISDETISSGHSEMFGVYDRRAIDHLSHMTQVPAFDALQ